MILPKLSPSWASVSPNIKWGRDRANLLDSVWISWHPISLYPVVAEEGCGLYRIGPIPREKETYGNFLQAFMDASFEPPFPHFLFIRTSTPGRGLTHSPICRNREKRAALSWIKTGTFSCFYFCPVWYRSVRSTVGAGGGVQTLHLLSDPSI